MNEKAATLASSIIEQIKDINFSYNNEVVDEIEVFDMLESAGMVLV